MRCEGLRPKLLVSLLGNVTLNRPYYPCRHCWRGAAPFDRDLGIEGTQYSPGVRRLVAVVGGEAPFARGREVLAELAGIPISVKAVGREAGAIGRNLAERLESQRRQADLRGFPQQTGEPIPTRYIQLDGTGIPVTPWAAPGLCGKNGAPTRTREVNLGCVVTQTDLDAGGLPVHGRGRRPLRPRCLTRGSLPGAGAGRPDEPALSILRLLGVSNIQRMARSLYRHG